MKYPIGIQSFDRLIEDGYVYVDKTDMVYSLAKEGAIMDFNGGEYTLVGSLRSAILGYISQWEKEYGIEDDGLELNLGMRFRNVLEKVHRITGRRAVVLVDEYDKPILDVLDVDKNLEDEHRNILKGFYSVFKTADEHLQFVFLTGVTKFSQVSVFSGFNQPKDISMHGKYETLCGISQEELDATFRDTGALTTRCVRCLRPSMTAIISAIS